MSQPAAQASPRSEGTDPREFLHVLWRRKWIVLACLILIPAAVFIYSEQLDKTYESTAVLQAQPSAADTLSLTGDLTAVAPSQSQTSTMAALIETSGVADRAARILGRRPGSLREVVSAEPDDEAGFVAVTATADGAGQAARIANAFVEAVRLTRERQGIRRVDAAIANLEAQLDELPLEDSVSRDEVSEELSRLRTLRAAQGQNIQLIERAEPADSPVSPKPARNALLGLIVAILIAAALVAFVDQLDRTVREPKDLEKLTGTPLLARVPASAFPGAGPDPRIPVVFQTLRDSLTFFNLDDALSTLVVISPLKGEGKTTVVANLGMAFARAGKRVVLVDADLRSPQLGPRMGVEKSPGLSDALLGGDPELPLQSVEPFEGRLQVLAGGSETLNPSELLGSDRMASLLGRLAKDSDIVIVDTAPLLVVSDAYAFLERASGLVGVARLDQTPRDATKDMVEVAITARGRLLGMVATGGREETGYRYGYSYGYSYGSAPAPLDSPLPPEASNGHVGEDLGKHVPSVQPTSPVPVSTQPGLGDRVRRLFRSS